MNLLLDASLRAILLVLVTGATLTAARIQTAAGRHLAWTIVLVGMLSLPLWVAWGPRLPLPVPSPNAAGPAPRAWTHPASPTPATSRAAAAAVTNVAVRSQPPQPVMSWTALALTLYGAGAFILLGRLALGTFRMRRLRRQAVSKAGHLTSEACSAPITVGWLRPVVLLPAAYDQWPARQLDAVLIHEYAHARRRDPLVQWLALLNRAIFWFHPLAWWLERQLAALAEEECDTAVLSRGHVPREYAEYLIGIARAVAGAGRRVQAVGTTLPGTSLSNRVRQILADRPRRTDSRLRVTLTVAFCSLSSVVIAVGTIRPMAARGPAPIRVAQQGQPAAQERALPEFWLDDDEWHREVAPIITADEAAAYARLRTAAERESFIAQFWRVRDTTPATSDNEFRREFERRIVYARERLGNPTSYAVPGYETDRGRFYVAWGPPADVTVSGPVEEWRYRVVPSMGSAVTIRFDASADFFCSVRGGKYRIVSPEPVARVESSAAGSGPHPVALTYPDRFVYLSFPIDAAATRVRFSMRARSGARTEFGEVRGPIDYIQGQIDGAPRNGGIEPILEHLARAGSVRFFERDSYACTEQLPADTYTLLVDTTLANGTQRNEELTFEVK
jgi:GWxTD domain-containing protein